MRVNKAKVGEACRFISIASTFLIVFSLFIYAVIMLIVTFGWLGFLLDIAMVAFMACVVIGNMWSDQ